MPLISLREFARRNGVSDMAISKAVRAGRLPHVNGKIDPDQAQPVWDRVKDPVRAGRKLPRGDSGASLQSSAGPNSCKLDRKLEVCTEVCRQTDDRSIAIQAQVCTPPGEQRTANLAPDAPQVCTTRHAKERQVYSIKGMPMYPEPPINGRDHLAITIWFNGAEEVVLDARRAEKGMSLPAYLLTAVGYPPAQLRPSKPSRRSPVRNWSERRSVTVVVSAEVFEDLYWRAIHARLSIPQYMRTVLGFGVRQYSNPATEARHREEDDAWYLLQKAGLDPQPYFPDEKICENFPK